MEKFPSYGSLKNVKKLEPNDIIRESYQVQRTFPEFSQTATKICVPHYFILRDFQVSLAKKLLENDGNFVVTKFPPNF